MCFISFCRSGGHSVWQYRYRILSECLLISNLPGKALKTFVELRGWPSNSTCILETEPSTLDIKDALISVQVGQLFKLAIMTLLSIL